MENIVEPKKNKKIIIGIFLIIIFSFVYVVTSQEVIYHTERIGTYITHVNGAFIDREPPSIILYDSSNPDSVQLQLVDYYFDGEKFLGPN